ncbi:MAG TPA: Rieske 2Fe-2S domain-containing protein [Acidobacteriota bacterium]|jgi:arsenite oxidase small subunit
MRPQSVETPRSAEPKWKNDFPLDYGEDEHVSRREFAKFLVLTSLGLFVGNCWIALKQWFGPSKGGFPQIRIAALDQIRIGEMLQFRYPDEKSPAILIRLSETELVAYGQKCTHLSCAVYWEPGDGRIACPCHHGFFDVRDGHVLAGPPPRSLPRIPLRIQGADIFATGVEI